MKKESEIQMDYAELNDNSIFSENNLSKAFADDNSFPLEIFKDSIQ